jgi:L-rhamnose isomerase
VTAVLSNSRKYEFDHDDASNIFTVLDKKQIHSWFSTASNGESQVDVDSVKNMISSFSDILGKGKSTQEIRDKAQLIVDIFRGKEKISHPAKFVEVDLKEMEKDIVKMEEYFKNHEGEQNYALAA